MTFDATLSYFKEIEKDAPESIVPLVNDLSGEMANALAVWKSVPISVDIDGECYSENDQEKWEWLWSQARVNEEKFIEYSGIKYMNAKSILERIKYLRLVYPDGTINEMARGIMQGILVKSVRGRGRPTKRSSE
tara:strand:+ start:376 stop:777 length:402 start_codon:yes stop_codon:yes gene_type:complete